eukprot:g396.t1
MWFATNRCTQIEDVASSEELGPNGYTSYIRNKQGLTLCQYFWPVANPIGVIFGVHGFGSYMGSFLLKRTKPAEKAKYANSIVQQLNKEGFSVAGLDLQGCGRSDGLHNRRAFFLQFTDLVDDLIEFITNTLESKNVHFTNSLPTFLFGASLGGCLAVHVAHRCQNRVHGVALLAPMLSLEKAKSTGVNWIYSYFAEVLNYLVPDVPLVALKQEVKFPEIQALWNADPAIYRGRIRPRVGYQCMKAIDWIQSQKHELNFPFIIFHGTEDTVCDIEGSKMFFEESNVLDKTLHLAEDMWHLLTAEPGHEKIIELLIQWFQQRCDAHSSSEEG